MAWPLGIRVLASISSLVRVPQGIRDHGGAEAVRDRGGDDGGSDPALLRRHAVRHWRQSHPAHGHELCHAPLPAKSLAESLAWTGRLFGVDVAAEPRCPG